MSKGDKSEVAVELKNVSFRFFKDRGFKGALAVFPAIRMILEKVPLCKPVPIEIFQSVSLDIYKGEIVGLLAMNGSGKSTLLRLMSGEYTPYEGSVKIYGHAPYSDKTRGRVLRIGPSSGLFSEFDAIENAQSQGLWFGFHPDDVAVGIKQILELINVSVNDMGKDAPTASAGTQMKIALARALFILHAHASRSADNRSNANFGGCYPVLLIDEPSAYLDPISSEQFNKALRELKRVMPDLTVIIATNDTQDLELCDKLIVIKDGELEDDTYALSEIKVGLAAYHDHALKASKAILQPKSLKNKDQISNFNLKIDPRPTNKNGISWRAWKELGKNKSLVFFLVMSIVVPNLLPLLVKGATLLNILTTGLGVFLTLTCRASYRILETEKSYYNNFVGMFFSPITRYKHVCWHAFNGLTNNIFYTGITIAVLLALYYGVLFTPSDSPIYTSAALVLLAAVPAGWMYSYGIGLMCSGLPFLFKVNNHFFLQAIIPLMALLPSGFYYPLENLPWPIAYIGKANPLTYIGHAFNTLHEPGDLSLVINSWSWGLVWLFLGYMLYRLGFYISHKANRMTEQLT